MRFHHITVLAVGLAGIAEVATAAPTWIEAPTYAQAAAAYPAKARAAHVAGSADLACTVALSGRLRDCEVVSETPGGYGLGGAARKLARGLRAVRTADLPANSEVQVTIGFTPEMAGAGPYVAPNPAWTVVPSAAEFQATFPKTENGVNDVRVVLMCDVAAGGALSACTVDSEAPAGQGYGAGALALAPRIKVGLLSASGVPLVGAKIRVPVHYELTPAPAKP